MRRLVVSVLMALGIVCLSAISPVHADPAPAGQNIRLYQR